MSSPKVIDIPLHETTREKYLNYALSVITSRALPDVRDGLKPVQRRILYAMYSNLRLLPEGRFRKSATVVGEVMGKYHPHGDSAIYDAMVRMAQWFSLRYPLVDGHGNFGSLDGDSPAAFRYTEAKLQPLAVSFLQEITKNTVEFRPNYDGSLSEPTILPAQVPNLLINGATGIAVGMATHIPPHNLREIVDATIALSRNSSLKSKDLLEFVKGPDFPTGGKVLNTQEELDSIYEKGEGTLHIRAQYEFAKLDNGKKGILITEIPYAINKSDLIEKIADHIREEKLPQVIDIRDESTDDVRIALELKRGADPEAAMSYLFKYTPLATRFHVNLTCLVPSDNPDVPTPAKINLKKALQHFLDYRLIVLTKRLQYDLEQLEKRIHILQGFVIVFNALDEAIKIIRASEDKADASQRLRHRFKLTEIQADAILETKLYRLSKLEIDDIETELNDKEKKAEGLRKILGSTRSKNSLVRKELEEIRDKYSDARRTEISEPVEEKEFSAEDYIVKEDGTVIVTRDGWIKRQKSYTELSAIRVREGDHVGWAIGASTLDTVCIFSSAGKAYTTRVDKLMTTTGHGVPIQKLFDFADRETVVGVVVMNDKVLPKPLAEPEGDQPALFSDDGLLEEVDSGPFVVCATSAGKCARFGLDSFRETSTKKGRTYMRPDKDHEILYVEVTAGDENICMASSNGKALIFPVQKISIFKGAGRGVMGMKLEKGDRVIGATVSDAARDGLVVETSRGREEIIRTTKFPVMNRANKGKNVITKGSLKIGIQAPIEKKL